MKALSMRIFTKRFFARTHRDQAAVVDSVLRELEMARPRDPNPDNRLRATQLMNRIVARAVKYGVYATRGRRYV